MLPTLKCCKCVGERSRQWIAVFVVTLTNMSVGLSASWPIAALPKIESNEAGFKLTIHEEAWVVGILFLSYLLCPIPCGYLSDWAGRKMSLFLTIWIQILSWGLLMYGVCWILILSRLLTGIWLGMVSTTVPMYIGEAVNPANRGSAFACNTMFLFFGAFTQSLMGRFMSYNQLTIVCLVFNVLLAVGLTLIPESPFYLIHRKRYSKAEEALIWLRGSCPPDLIPSLESSMSPQAPFKELFFKKNSKPLVIVLCALFVQRSCGITILLAFASITLPHTFIDPATSSILVTGLWVICNGVSSFFIDYFPRKKLMLVSCSGTFLAFLPLTTWYFMKDKTTIDVSKTHWVPLVCCLVHGVFLSLGIMTVPVALQGEMFPLSIKGRASAMGTMVAALTALTVSIIFLPIRDATGVYVNFLIAAIASLIGVFLAAFLVIETRRKTLEEIQETLMWKKNVSRKSKT